MGQVAGAEFRRNYRVRQVGFGLKLFPLVLKIMVFSMIALPENGNYP
jgi:hypothetical protein